MYIPHIQPNGRRAVPCAAPTPERGGLSWLHGRGAAIPHDRLPENSNRALLVRLGEFSSKPGRASLFRCPQAPGQAARPPKSNRRRLDAVIASTGADKVAPPCGGAWGC